MSTYANVYALKWTILTVTIMSFVIGVVLTAQATFYLILKSQMDLELRPVLAHNETNKKNHFWSDRFPSAGSISVKLIFGLTTSFTAVFGLVAIITGKVQLLNSHGLFCFFSFFIKYLFVFATLKMYGKNYNYNPIALTSVQICVLVGVFELVIGMCSCHIAKILKRGCGGIPQIRKWSFSQQYSCSF